MNTNNKIILNKKKSIAPIVGGVAAVAALGAAAAIAINVPAVNNTVRMTFSSPEEYYSHVLRSQTTKSAEQISDNYKKSCEKMAEGHSYKGEASFAFDEKFSEYMGMNGAFDVALGYNVSMSEYGKHDGSFDLNLSVSDKSIADANVTIADNTAYFAIPTISESWVCFTMEEASEMAGYDITTESANVTLYDGTVLTPERTEAVVNRYVDIYLKHAKNVTLNKNIEMTTDSGISQTFNEAIVSLSADEFTALAEEFSSTIKTDPDLKAIWLAAGMTEDDYNEMTADISVEDTVFEAAEIRTYIDKKGNISGFDIKSGDTDVSFMTYVMDKSYAAVYDIKEGENDTAVTITGTADGELYSGKAVFSSVYNGESSDNIEITFDAVDLKALNEGIFKGSIASSFAVSDTETISFNLIGKGDYSEVSMDIDTEEGKVTMVVYDEEVEYTEVTAPTGNMISLTDEEAIEDYFVNADYTLLKENIRAVSDIIGDELAEQFISMLDMMQTEYAAE